MKIYKYPFFDITQLKVDCGTFCTIQLPHDAVGLAVHRQGLMLVYYAAVDETQQFEDTHTFYVIGTGYPLDAEVKDYTFCGTFSDLNFGLVAHVFHKVMRDIITTELLILTDKDEVLH